MMKETSAIMMIFKSYCPSSAPEMTSDSVLTRTGSSGHGGERPKHKNMLK